jgi:predicted GH43/DUF377 family glycosyl hydrolase
MGTGYILCLSWAYLVVMGQQPTSSTNSVIVYAYAVSLFKTAYVLVSWNSYMCARVVFAYFKDRVCVGHLELMCTHM